MSEDLDNKIEAPPLEPALSVDVKIIPGTFEEDTAFALAKTKSNYWKKILENQLEDTLVGMDNVTFHNDSIQIIVDVRGYIPENITCSLSPNTVEVYGEKQVNSSDTKRKVTLTRHYQMKQRIRPECGCVSLSSDGILLIHAPWE